MQKQIAPSDTEVTASKPMLTINDVVRLTGRSGERLSAGLSAHRA